MAKKSLIISDKEKYGSDSMMSKIASSGPGKFKQEKHAPTVDLTGPQVDAWGLDSAKVGEKFCVMVHGIVKSSSAGESYSDRLPNKKATARVVVSLTHVDSECEPPEDGEVSTDGEDGDSESEGEDGDSDDTGGAEEADSGDEAAEEADTKPKAEPKDTVSPKDAGLDDEED
jgi:hypothetical protein